MADSFTQVYLQLVFSTRQRIRIIEPEWKADLHRYMAGILKNQKQLPIAINSMPDHIHVLFSMRPQIAMSEVIRELKADSTNWVNENRKSKRRFAWQNGFALFYYSQSQLPRVVHYIEQQEYHNRFLAFEDEYSRLLDLYQVDRAGKKVID